MLPTRVPNLLVNGSSGIAVGMATNIPPHNLGEVVDACLHLLASRTAVEDLIKRMPAPDFPTAGIIYGLAGVHEGYRTGRGRVVMRARTHFEDIGKGDRQAIIVDELPYQVNKKVLLEKLAEMVTDKRPEGISDLRDESDKSGMRMVIELKRGERPRWCSTTSTRRRSCRTLPHEHGGAGRRPAAPALAQGAARGFISHRREVVTRRTVYELRQARSAATCWRACGGALQRRRGDRAHQEGADAGRGQGGLMARAWKSDLVRSMLAGTRGAVPARRPVPEFGKTTATAVRRAGAGDPRAAGCSA